MSIYAKIKDNRIILYPYRMQDLLADNPHTIYHSSDIYEIYQTTKDYIDNGFRLAKIVESEKPQANVYQVIKELSPELNSEGEWVQVWDVQDLSEEQALAIKMAEWENVRELRNKMLLACDWTQMPDSPVQDSLWHSYRQALRDITLQDDPFNITWPEPPG